MPIRPCPDCRHQTPRQLQGISPDALVWYYRCDQCGHVWNVEKRDLDGLQRPVTEPRIAK
jgi:hypothetical protein